MQFNATSYRKYALQVLQFRYEIPLKFISENVIHHRLTWRILKMRNTNTMKKWLKTNHDYFNSNETQSNDEPCATWGIIKTLIINNYIYY